MVSSGSHKHKRVIATFPHSSQVWVKVVEVTPDERSGDMRVNGSLRVVDQSNGTDLDPGNTQTGHGRGARHVVQLPWCNIY